MLSSDQLDRYAAAATLVRCQLEGAILPAPSSPSTMIAFMLLSEAERAVQADLTAASAHLANAAAALHRAADRGRRVIDGVAI